MASRKSSFRLKAGILLEGLIALILLGIMSTLALQWMAKPYPDGRGHPVEQEDWDACEERSKNTLQP